MHQLAQGDVLGRFTVLGEIGRGGMAVVYKARQDDLGRIVALKVFNTLPNDTDTSLLQRFNDEARHLARLSHPNIVQIYDIGEQDGLRYIAMEYINGPTLADRIGTERINPERILHTVRDIAAALQYAHDSGVLHRDITPGNIKLRHDRNVPVIMDFGLSKELTGEEPGSRDGLLIGTAAYMSPEQADGRPVDVRSDIFSLGVIMYEMLTHNNPFRASDGLKQTVVNILTLYPRAMRKCIPWLERDIETITHKALEKDRNSRYNTAGELADDITRHLDGEPIKARPASLPFRLYRKIRKHKIQAAVTAGLLILLAGTIAGYLRMAEYRAHQLRTIRIVHVQGDVSIHPTAGNDSRHAEVGMELDGSHTVRTGPGASMTVMIGNTIKMVDENTHVEFNFTKVQGKDEIAVNTLFGTLLSQFDGYNPELRTIKVLTPGFNTEPDRQSSFNVHVAEGRSEIQVFRGNVVIAEAGGDTGVNVPSGKKISAGGSGLQPLLQELTQDDVEAVRRRVSPDMFSRLLGAGGNSPEDNKPPVFSSTPATAVAFGSTYRHRLMADDPDDDPLLYSLVTGPAGMSVEPYSGVLVWPGAVGELTPVTVAVTDNAGGTVRMSFTVRAVRNDPPVINVHYSAVPGTGRMTFLFDAAKTVDEMPENLCFRWDFNGDGKWEYAGGTGGAAQPVVEYTFPREGKYRIILDASDAVMNRAVKHIHVWAGKACFADAGRDTSVNLSGRVRFLGEGFSRIGTVTAYEWDFDADGIADRRDKRPVPTYRTYDKPGRYQAVLTVRDNQGELATDTVRILVSNAQVRATVAAPSLTVKAGDAVVLEGRGTDPDGSISGYAWDFDGNGSDDWKSERTGSVTTRYRRPGTYRAGLTVTAADGSVARTEINVTVTP